jgi:hypothetical protein
MKNMLAANKAVRSANRFTSIVSIPNAGKNVRAELAD